MAGVLSAGPAAAAAQPIVLDPQVLWSDGCGISNTTDRWRVAPTPEGTTRFAILEPGFSVNFRHPAVLDIDAEAYPTLSLTYRGEGMLAGDKNAKDVIVFSGQGTKTVKAVRSSDMIMDGQTHTLEVDLRELGAQRLGLLSLRVHASGEDAWFELMDLRWLPADGETLAEAEVENEPVVVTVVDEQGQPLAGATVSLNPHLANASATATTDAQGRAEVVSPHPGAAARSTLRVDAEGRAPVWFTRLKEVPTSEVLSVKLHPSTTIGGQVVDESGEPVAGAYGVLWAMGGDFPSRQGGPTYGMRSRRVVTDDQGRWEIAGLPDSDKVPLSIRWMDPNYIVDRWGGQYSGKPSMDELRAGEARNVLQKGVAVTGRVYDKDSKPLAGAFVAQGRDRMGSNSPPSTTTDAEGHFTFPHTEAGPLVLTVQAKGHAPAALETQAFADASPVDFHLQPASIFRIRVVDSAGKPIQGAHVCPDTWQGYRIFEYRKYTDADGLVTWEGPADPVDFDIFKGVELGQARDEIIHPSGPDGEPHVVTLGQPLTLTLKVVDAATGEPVERFTVVTGIMHQLGGRAPYFMRREAKVVANDDGTWQHRFGFPYPYRVVRVEADGYAPATTDPIPQDAGAVERRLELTAAKPMAGTLVDATGEPIAYADVYLYLGSSGIQIKNGKAQQVHDLTGMITDIDGRFSFPPQGEAFRIIALHDKGYADIDHDAWAASDDGRFALEPWATVRGMLRVGNEPAANERVGGWMVWGQEGQPQPPHHRLETSTDDQGRFVLDRVPPGVEGGVGRYMRLSQNSWGYDQSERFTAAAGETIEVELGGHGRPIIGRLAWADDSPHDAPLSNGRRGLSTYVDHQAARELFQRLRNELMPEGFKDWTPEEYRAFAETDEGKQVQERVAEAHRDVYGEQRYHNFAIESDGSFRIENVGPGVYELSVNVAAPPVGNQCGLGEALGQLTHKVEVPPLPDGMAYFAEPLDVGELRVEAMKLAPAIGEPAPTFALPVLPIADADEQADGDERADLDLAALPTMGSDDLAGKVTLIYFGASWCGPCHAEVPHLTETFDAFGDDPRFGMMTVSLDQTPAAAIAYAEKNDSRWPQLYSAGMFESDVAKGFAVRGIPSVWLIGPDGKVVARNLRGAAILPAVRQHLGSLPAKAAR